MEGDLQAYEGAAFLANTKPQTDEDSFEYDIINNTYIIYNTGCMIIIL